MSPLSLYVFKGGCDAPSADDASDEIATSFYIALPPQTFANGFTVEIESDGYKPMTLSTENALIIERNTIQPMACVECDATPNIPYDTHRR